MELNLDDNGAGKSRLDMLRASFEVCASIFSAFVSIYREEPVATASGSAVGSFPILLLGGRCHTIGVGGPSSSTFSTLALAVQSTDM
jgi:hypothetical protein